jgi:predicted nucleic acid-binding protein
LGEYYRNQEVARTRSEALVVDASVIVKWFVNESFTEQSMVLKKDQVGLSVRIVIPTLAKYEVLNALRYSSEFGTEDLLRISKDLDGYQFVEIPFEQKYSEVTVDIATKYGLTIYDSSYIAIGQERSLPVYTADQRVLDKTRDLNFMHHIREYS